METTKQVLVCGADLKIGSYIFSQDAAVIRSPRNEKRTSQGWDVKKTGRALRSDTGQALKRYAPVSAPIVAETA
ncbi:MAG: hypothetical protein FWC92_03420 [Defluviitaleaceae bacterium]|nr:hypothetical protein [Defluviitaleaceae bacterium]